MMITKCYGPNAYDYTFETTIENTLEISFRYKDIDYDEDEQSLNFINNGEVVLYMRNVDFHGYENINKMLRQAIRGHQENIKIRDGVAHESL
jgi:uncharacterized protein VirK/YbjX